MVGGRRAPALNALPGTSTHTSSSLPFPFSFFLFLYLSPCLPSVPFLSPPPLPALPSGHLSYAQDPQALRSLLVRPFGADHRSRHTDGDAFPSSSPSELIAAFTEDPFLLAFARHFCTGDSAVGRKGMGSQVSPPPPPAPGYPLPSPSTPPSHPPSPPPPPRPSLLQRESRLCAGVLYECLTREKPDLLVLHFSLLHVLQVLPTMDPVAAACTVRAQTQAPGSLLSLLTQAHVSYSLLSLSSRSSAFPPLPSLFHSDLQPAPRSSLLFSRSSVARAVTRKAGS